MSSDIQEIIIRVLQNKVTDSEMRTFLSWFYVSEENKKLFFQMKQIYNHRKENSYLTNTDIEASWVRLWQKFKNDKNRKTTTAIIKAINPNRWKIIIAASITTLLVLGATLFYSQKEQTNVWVSVCTAPREQPKLVELPDGSSVKLNASSFLKYPKKFKKNKREVFLDGEALFDIVKHEKKSFIVHSDQQQITVLGTEFNVLAYSSEPNSITTLIKGKIQLQTFDSDNKVRHEVIIKPNQQFSINKKNQQITCKSVETDNVISWITGIYSFQDTPLEQIASRLEKLYGITILIPNEMSRDEKYNGKFSTEQNIEEIIQIINFRDQFDYFFHNDTITLETK